MIDWQILHYDPIYSVLGVEAIVSSSGGQSATVTAIDKTNGVSITDARTFIDTIRPVAVVRAAELTQNSIEVSDLPEGAIDINGQSWRIKSFRLKPAPTGSSDGEVELILLSEDV
jgi:hypothetical protein